jgi:putative transposase
MHNRKPANQVVADKRRWHLGASDPEAAAGFRGWHTRGYLPHFDKPGLVQMVTYRLADALPRELRAEWESLLTLEDEREKHRRIEAYLDAGHGSCLLRRADVASIVQENLLHGDGRRYRLIAWVIMPNHVHTLFEITDVPLDRILHGWKSYTAHRISETLGSTGTIWQPDYFDRYMRDREHFDRSLRYIERNPVKAGLVAGPEEWPWSSARWRSQLPTAETAYRPETNPLNHPDEYRAK